MPPVAELKSYLLVCFGIAVGLGTSSVIADFAPIFSKDPEAPLFPASCFIAGCRQLSEKLGGSLATSLCPDI